MDETVLNVNSIEEAFDVLDKTWVLRGHDADPKEILGYIPYIIQHDDKRSIKEQVNERYQHGGGYHPIPGFQRNDITIQYPGDPPLNPIAVTVVNNEILMLYQSSLLMIMQPDKSFEVIRLD